MNETPALSEDEAVKVAAFGMDEPDTETVMVHESHRMAAAALIKVNAINLMQVAEEYAAVNEPAAAERSKAIAAAMTLAADLLKGDV